MESIGVGAKGASWTQTHVWQGKGRHDWTVDDFLERISLMKVGAKLHSRPFQVPIGGPGNEVNMDFQLEVHRCGQNEGDEVCFEVNLVKKASQREASAKFVILLRGRDGAKMVAGGCTTYKEMPLEQSLIIKSKLIKKGDLMQKHNNALSYSTVTFACFVGVKCHEDREIGGTIDEDDPSYNYIDLMRMPSLAEDQMKIVNQLNSPSDFSDIQVICGDKTFYCHKVLLSTRSDVFATMLSNSGTKEVTLNTVGTEDVKQEVAEQFLRFMYTDEIEHKKLQLLAWDLLKVADKFKVQRLKLMCEEPICNRMEVNNAVDTLVLAHQHGTKTLRQQAIEFVKQNFAEVSKTPGWKELSSPELLRNIVTKAMLRS